MSQLFIVALAKNHRNITSLKQINILYQEINLGCTCILSENATIYDGFMKIMFDKLLKTTSFASTNELICRNGVMTPKNFLIF